MPSVKGNRSLHPCLELAQPHPLWLRQKPPGSICMGNEMQSGTTLPTLGTSLITPPQRHNSRQLCSRLKHDQDTLPASWNEPVQIPRLTCFFSVLLFLSKVRAATSKKVVSAYSLDSTRCARYATEQQLYHNNDSKHRQWHKKCAPQVSWWSRILPSRVCDLNPRGTQLFIAIEKR